MSRPLNKSDRWVHVKVVGKVMSPKERNVYRNQSNQQPNLQRSGILNSIERLQIKDSKINPINQSLIFNFQSLIQAICHSYGVPMSNVYGVL